MSRRRNESPIPASFEPLAERLHQERPRPTAEELDRAKLRALSQSARTAPARRAPRLPLMRSRRVVSIALAVGLMTSGTAVIAKSGGPSSASSKSQGSSANSQYCPPSSPGAGNPKKPGPAKCGHP